MARINGTKRSDTLRGTDSADQLSGSFGSDWLDGGMGADYLSGGDHNDTLIGLSTGRSTRSTAVRASIPSTTRHPAAACRSCWAKAASAGSATAYAVTLHGTMPNGQSYTLFRPAVQEDTLYDIENVIGTAAADFITGNSADNRLAGGAGNDDLKGGGGNDTLISGLGNDTLTGGQGADTFKFNDYRDSGTTNIALAGGGYSTIQHGLDTIMDFFAGEDRIDLSGIDANSLVAGNQAFSVVDEFTGAAGQLTIWDSTEYSSTQPINENYARLYGDVDGDGNYDFMLTVVHTSFDHVTAADVIL